MSAPMTHTEPPAESILELRDIVTDFHTVTGPVRAVNGVSYHVAPGETLGVVGESGSGKSVTVMSALGLLPNTAEVSGQALFRGRDLITMPDRERQRVLGRDIGLVFQDPMTALNPVMTIGAQIDESLRRHSPDLGRHGRADRIVELLTEVGIPAPKERVHQYPHQFSGGMRQRAMIAMSIANRPALLIADEPTTALDVTVQAQILDLLLRLCQDNGTALVLITHDLGVIAEVAQRVVVMYAGRVVESGEVDAIFHDVRHPYTRGLLDSLPRVDDRPGDRLRAIPGAPPDPRRLPLGCSYRTRCSLSAGRDLCETTPNLESVADQHFAACHFQSELAGADRSEASR